MMTALSLAAAMTGPPPPPARHQDEILRRVEDARLTASVRTLASFGTRHTLSETESKTRGIGAARTWLKAELERISAERAAARPNASKMGVELESFDAPRGPRLPDGAAVVNVLATIPGSMPEASDRRYYVVGHYDSRNADPLDAAGDAPGANDNASGCAVVLECARVLAAADLESTIVFLLTAGEEQGLIGAQFHAAQAAGRGDNILGVLNNDIVGDPSDPANAGNKFFIVRVFSEGLPRTPTAERLAAIRTSGGENDSSSRQLARFVEWVAGQHDGQVLNTAVIARSDRFLRGGDHLAFNDSGYPAVRFTVYREHFDRQHVNVTTRDSLPYGDVDRYCSAEYMGRVARLNIAALVNLAQAPRTPRNARIIVKELDNRTLLKWDPCPEPDVAGYEVLHRPTIETAWSEERVIDVGLVDEITLNLSKDDHFFAVRAYDRVGYRSPPAFAEAARR